MEFPDHLLFQAGRNNNFAPESQQLSTLTTYSPPGTTLGTCQAPPLPQGRIRPLSIQQSGNQVQVNGGAGSGVKVVGTATETIGDDVGGTLGVMDLETRQKLGQQVNPAHLAS